MVSLNQRCSTTCKSILKMCLQKFLTKFRRKTPVLESLFKNLLKKETLVQLFSCEFCEISKNTFFTEHLLQSWRLLLLFIDLSLTFLSPLCSQLAIGTLYSVSLFYNLTNFYDSCSYLSSLLFLLPKTEFVSSFALCSVLPFCRLSVVRLCY